MCVYQGDHLRAAGYNVELLIGHSGTIYTSHTLDNMKQLGISTFHARKCALKMHVDAICNGYVQSLWEGYICQEFATPVIN